MEEDDTCYWDDKKVKTAEVPVEEQKVQDMEMKLCQPKKKTDTAQEAQDLVMRYLAHVVKMATKRMSVEEPVIMRDEITGNYKMTMRKVEYESPEDYSDHFMETL